MATKKKTTKPKKEKPPKNPTDPNLLGRSVVEAFLGEPLSNAKPASPASSKKRKSH